MAAGRVQPERRRAHLQDRRDVGRDVDGSPKTARRAATAVDDTQSGAGPVEPFPAQGAAHCSTGRYACPIDSRRCQADLPRLAGVSRLELPLFAILRGGCGSDLAPLALCRRAVLASRLIPHGRKLTPRCRPRGARPSPRVATAVARDSRAAFGESALGRPGAGDAAGSAPARGHVVELPLAVADLHVGCGRRARYDNARPLATERVRQVARCSAIEPD